MNNDHYVTGQIKGNTVTNAVALAVARHGKSTNLEHLKTAAKDILALHSYVEHLDVLSFIQTGQAIQEATTIVEDI